MQARERDTFNDLLIVELLKEKRIMTQEEWEQKIKSKVEKATENYCDLDT